MSAAEELKAIQKTILDSLVAPLNQGMPKEVWAAGMSMEIHRRFIERPSIHTKDILNAYDAFEGDDVGTFTAAWDEYLAGTDTPCTAAADGLHEVTAGSCDLCGSRNFA